MKFRKLLLALPLALSLALQAHAVVVVDARSAQDGAPQWPSVADALDVPVGLTAVDGFDGQDHAGITADDSRARVDAREGGLPHVDADLGRMSDQQARV